MKLSKAYIINLIGSALKQGITPQKLAVTCAAGAVVGIFPIMGTTTLLCLGIALWFRLNVPIIQLVNYLVTALQVLLIFPFLQTGIRLFNLSAFDYTKDQLIDLFKNNFWLLMKNSGAAVAGGIGVWFLVAVPLFIIIYYSTLFLFKKWMRNNPQSVAVTEG